MDTEKRSLPWEWQNINRRDTTLAFAATGISDLRSPKVTSRELIAFDVACETAASETELITQLWLGTRCLKTLLCGLALSSNPIAEVGTI